MSTPPNHLGFELVPHDDSDPKREAEATKAVREAIVRLAREHGIEVRNEPESPSPESQENQERSQEIERELEPKLFEATARFRKEEIVEEEHLADGSFKRRAHRITDIRMNLSGSLRGLQDLVDKCTYGIGGAVKLVCKAASWAYDQVRSRD